MEKVRTGIAKNVFENPHRDIFFDAEHHIYELMKKNVYPRFLQSEQYKKMLETAQIVSKKK